MSPNLEDESRNEQFMLRNQPVKEMVVKSEEWDDEGSGLAENCAQPKYCEYEGKTMAEIIRGFEGLCRKVYKDTKGLRTVGVGFNMDQEDARKIFEKYIPKSDVSFDDILEGKKELTKKQALDLFQGTLNKKIQTTKRIFPNYNDYPAYVKTALVNGVFRGEFESSHKTVKYINSGKWDGVAEEYLDRDDYRSSKPGNNGGIKKRMDCNADTFRKYANELNTDQGSSD